MNEFFKFSYSAWGREVFRIWIWNVINIRLWKIPGIVTKKKVRKRFIVSLSEGMPAQ